MSARVWRATKAASRPWPVLCEDDVVDFQVMEAVYLKVTMEDIKNREKAEKEQKKKDWKKDISSLREQVGK